MNRIAGIAMTMASILFLGIGVLLLLGRLEPTISWRFAAATTILTAALWGGLLAREWLRDGRELMLTALNIMFYKVPAPPGYLDGTTSRDDMGKDWVAELGDKNIKVQWDSETGGFK